MERLPHIWIADRAKMEICGQHADDCARSIIEHKGPAHHIIRAAESPLPPSIADKDGPRRRLQILPGAKIASSNRLDSQSLQEGVTYAGCRDKFRRAQSAQHTLVPSVPGKRVENGVLPLPVEIIRIRSLKLGTDLLLPYIENMDKAPWIAIGQRTD